MDFVFELLTEFLVEGILAIIANEKISKWIRYPLFLLLCFFCLGIVLGIGLLGIVLWKKDKIIALFFLLVSFLLSGCGIWKLYPIKRKCNRTNR